MAFKFTKQQEVERQQHVSALAEARNKLEAAVEEFNALLSDAFAKVEAAGTSYNETLEEAKLFITGITDDAQSEWDDKSERWQEGEKAEQATAWIEALNEFDSVEAVDVSEQEPLSIEADGDEILINLPSSSDEV